MKSWSAYPIRFLLVALCEKPEHLLPEEKASAGSVARRLLEFATAQTPRDKALIRSGIETVCRTYDSDAVASKALLSSILTKENLQAFGYEDIPTLAREAQRLIGIAPDFVRDLYAAAFGFKETSTDQTAMGAGRILPLTSNRRQDYDQGLWQLGQSFPAFLRAAPELAVEALIAAVESNVGESILGNAPPQQFDFRGCTAQIKADRSYIWDTTQYRHKADLKMLDAFEAELHRVANEPTLLHAENQILSAVIEKNNLASVWRKVLRCGTRNQSGFGKRIAALASSIPILTGLDTSSLAGDFITAIYPEISVEEREPIENAILSIPDVAGADRRDAALRIRDRLLGCIPSQLASSDEAKHIIAQFTTQGGPPPNHPPFQMGVSSGGVYTDSQFLTDQGVPIQAEPNQRILQLTAPIKAFVAAHSQNAPTIEEIEAIIMQARTLHAALCGGPNEGAHDLQIENGLNHLLSFCNCAARCETLDCITEIGQFIRQLLLEGARHRNPVFDERWATNFDTHPSWGPAPRIDAAEGLMFLAFKPACINDAVVQEIVRLSKDPVPEVRLQIADHLEALGKTSAETMKALLCEMAEHDPSSTVVLSLLNHQIGPLAPENPEEVGRLVTLIFGRTDLTGEMAAEVRLTCVFHFLDLFLWRDQASSETLIRSFAEDVLEFTEEATRITASLREILIAGPIEPVDLICENARKRAFSILEAIVSSAQRGFSTLQQNHRDVPFSDWPKEAQAKAQALAQLGDLVSMQLYFASGAFEEKSSDSQAQSQPISVKQKKRLLKEAGPLIDLLSDVPHPSTVHHLIEMLQSLLNISPREVFLRMTRIVQAGKSGGYQQESLAIDLIVKVVNMVLADFRPLLRDDQEMRAAMVSILDIFVEAGWPQAIQLTYRLDEIFR